MSVAAPHVTDARPPRALLALLNPVLRLLLRTSAGRIVTPVALLEFRGRRSGRRYRVPVGWHAVGDEPVVFTPARWRVNFRDGCETRVTHRGRGSSAIGTLVTDPDAVAAALREVLAAGVPPRMLGFRMPVGHVIDVDDVRALDKAMIRFTGWTVAPPA